MGFYAPAQIVRDARDHGVKVRPVCVNNSRFDCTLEPTGEKDAKGDERFAVRLGMRLVKGLSNKHAADIVNVRQDRSFASVDDLWRRAGVPAAALVCLAEADAFYRRFRLPDARRSGPSRPCGMSRCRFSPPPPVGKMPWWMSFRNLPSR